MKTIRVISIFLTVLILWVLIYDLAVWGSRFTVWMGTKAPLIP